ncbi:MAG: site-2 protease family protein [Thermoguttaceae bacterium]|nr:site-2 protease family protein [Thermoguttaceae bacterium]
MDLSLNLWAVTNLSSLPSIILRVVEVLIGINALIIVHEFGHFIAARLCGVRCEKFFIWFDAWGYKFFSFKVGNTEYGLGWLPLGGYVKMLGQEDNPGQIKEELARAKEGAQEGDGTDSEAAQKRVEQLSKAIYAKDSFQSKNVFQRMVIISAGVIMNVIFAVICAAAAYVIGFPETTSRVGTVLPGTPAWTAGLRAGDEVIAMDDEPVTLFSQIPTGLMNGGEVSVKVQRGNEEFTVEVTPRRDADDLMPIIGVLPAASIRLAMVDPPYELTEEDAQKAGTEEALSSLKPGDLLISMNGTPIETPADYELCARRFLDEPIDYIFVPTDKNGQRIEGENKSVTLYPSTFCESGIRLTMGEIAAIQSGSPAEKAGLRPRCDDGQGLVSAGDIILAVNGVSVTDPLALPIDLFRLSRDNASVVLTVQRDGESIDVPVTLASQAGYTGIRSHRGELACDALGVSYYVEPVISGTDARVTIPDAAKPIGAAVRKISVVTLSRDGQRKHLTLDTADLSEDQCRAEVLDLFTQRLALLDSSAQIAVTAVQKDGTEVVLTTTPQPSAALHRIDRGLIFGVDTRQARAQSLCSALDYGWSRTVESMGLVFQVLKNVGRNVSAKAFGGPGMIVSAAWTATSSGDGLFLVLLCVISANLAVVNILPIPVLDGGHLVFLLYEAIFRKPANENVQVILSYIGLFLLLALMAWVILLDIARWVGWM